MILTVTPNPSLDRTYELPGLTRGAVLRATADRVDPGGKGVNVSRAVAAAGHRTVAVAPLGGPEGALLARLLGEHGIEAAGVQIAGSTRVNVTLVEPDGTLTKVNAAGPEITRAEAGRLLDTVRARSAGADWIACCGSLPRGLSPQWYAELVARSHGAGVRIALDTSGAALVAALRERPDVIKPNTQELAEAVGRPLTTVGDALKAAQELRELGARAVLASLGAVELAAGGVLGSPLRRRPGRCRPERCRRGRRLARGIPVRGRDGSGCPRLRRGARRRRRAAARKRHADARRPRPVRRGHHRGHPGGPGPSRAGPMTAPPLSGRTTAPYPRTRPRTVHEQGAPR